jgi:diguanylate cyclase (GGDEF)-like protein/PAS domain S-box-containing protein
MEREMTIHVERTDLRVVAILHRLTPVVYAAVGLMSSVILMVWLLDSSEGITPAMTADTASALVLTSIAGLGSLTRVSRGTRALACGALVVCGLTALDYVASLGIGIEPSRMGPTTVIALVLLATSILTLHRRNPHLGQFLALNAAALALIAIIGAISGRDQIGALSHVTLMPPPGALAILLLAIARLASEPTRGWMAVITSSGSGGSLARRLIPAVLVLPLLAGYVVLGAADRGVFEAQTAQWILLIAISGSLVVLVFRLSRSLQTIEHEQATASERSHSFFDLSQDMLCTIGLDRRLAEMNPSWTKILGFTPAELRSRPAIEFVHPDDRERTIQLSEKALEAGGEETVLENRWQTKDGDWRWLSWSLRTGHEDVQLYGIATDVTERKRAEEELSYLARHDQLTGLANRHKFHEVLDGHLARTRRYGWRGALLAIDLDGLKTVNDALGHAAGDTLLRTAARRMGECLRHSDLIGRLGGDEFAVLLPEADALNARAVAEKLATLMSAEIAGEIAPRASVGVALIDGPTDPETLFARADTALYAAKAASGGTYRMASSQTTGGTPHSPAWGKPLPRTTFV